MKSPVVREHMTRLPVEIERIENVGNAERMMELFGIRHVPVMSGSHLKGIISQRDILQARIRLGTSVDEMPIEELCQQDVLSVGPLTPVGEVTRQMVEKSVGSALVVDGNFVVGIFTSTDALKLLTKVFGK